MKNSKFINLISFTFLQARKTGNKNRLNNSENSNGNHEENSSENSKNSDAEDRLSPKISEDDNNTNRVSKSIHG